MPSSAAPSPAPRDLISLPTAISIIVGNMIGTGVFTSLGFQVVDLRSGFSLLLLWIVGGVFALCGALSYAELAAALPRSGGEFNFLSRTFHPALGFLAGWVSVTVGFAAPIALAAMAFGRYFARAVPGSSPLVLSLCVVALVTLFHLRNLRLGSYFQNTFTVLKVVLILTFLVAPFLISSPSVISFAPGHSDLTTVVSRPFWKSVLFVMYAYSGWNASTYIVSEVRNPRVNVPRSLILGTSLVLVLYVGLHWVFLSTTPIAEIEGQLEVGHIVATRIFGEAGARWMSGMLCIALVSSISAMTWAGPRVTQVIGEDFGFFRVLARTTRAGIPALAILVQSLIVGVLLVTATFEQVLVYVQFTLVASSGLTVLGVFQLRRKAPELPRPYRTWGYPVTPLLFLAISVVTMGYTLVNQPWESLAGLATVLLGLPVYFLSPRTPTALAGTQGEEA